jgi:UDP-N-acetylglucosamine 2-epimerase (non-hydrolysing)
MKVLVAFGTRPEAIKLAPVIAELRRRPGFDLTVAVTAQHRELLDQVLDVFGITADVDLALMQPSQSLASLTSRVVLAMDELIDQRQPDLTIVQGDTTSAFVAALAAFYRGVPVVHVEAGLRTSTALNPFPEELNRRLTTVLATLHCAPTTLAERALLSMGVSPSAIVVTGNPIVDALQHVLRSPEMAAIALPSGIDLKRRLVLVTVHRRENWVNLPDVCAAIREIAAARPEVQLALPVHPNPIVQETLTRELCGTDRVVLLPALDYLSFIKLMSESWLVLTDSGGVQEEAPVLGKPVLVMREETERPEAIEAGVARIVGARREGIVAGVLELLASDAARARMAQPVSPFGDGHAAARIADAIEQRRGEIEAFRSREGNPRARDTARNVHVEK